MGKIYKLLGRKAEALRAYNKALDLDQKDTNLVKGLIEKLHGNDEISEDNDLHMLWNIIFALISLFATLSIKQMYFFKRVSFPVNYIMESFRHQYRSVLRVSKCQS